MKTLDLRKDLKYLYNPSSKQPAIVQVPPFEFAMIDGAIEPGLDPNSSPSFAAALAALYGISYTLKFMSKQDTQAPVDYPVMPLEAIWWIEQGDFDYNKKDNWCWRAMILQPDHITAAIFAAALEKLRRKQGDAPALDLLRLERFDEGLVVQMLHLGPYSEEPATMDRMRAHAAAEGLELDKHHHEIYLGDPRRTPPAKLKTVLRYQVARAR